MAKRVLCFLFLVFLAPAHARGLDQFTPYSEFSSWDLSVRRVYWREIREAWSLYEMGSRSHPQLGESSMTALFELLQIEPKANAAPTTARYCPVGGWERPMIKVSATGRMVCPTTGKTCGTLGERGFECGPVYNRACVSRLPIRDLTERCQNAAGDRLPSKDDFENAHRAIVQSENRCRYGEYSNRFKLNCLRLSKRLSQIRAKYGFIGHADPTEPTAVQVRAAARTTQDSSTAACFPARSKRIQYDGGGLTMKYMIAANNLRKSGMGLEIHGRCSSACLLYVAALPKDRICVGSSAQFGFHDKSGQFDSSVDRVKTEEFVRLYYTPELRRLWDRHKDDHPDGLVIKLAHANELLSFYQPCSRAKRLNNCAAGKPGVQIARRSKGGVGEAIR